ncbi:MAG: outer membrane protein TolC [Planctomycetota bacterium]|jgi:outer membrane protein TolC
MGNAELENSYKPGQRELAAFAITHNPGLAAIRAQWDVHQSLLVEAGLLPDVQVSWDAMDVLASQITDGNSSSTDVIAGFGFLVPLRRPGELDAREGIASGQLDGVRLRIKAAEWELTRKIFVACEKLSKEQQLTSQTEELAQLLKSTSDFFRRAQEAGAVTAIEANLALGELQAMQLKGIRAQANALLAQQELNALLGLPPATAIDVVFNAKPEEYSEMQLSIDDLTNLAIKSRPDLLGLLADYEVSEAQLRLAISEQYPMIAIGTGLQLTLPLFSNFGEAAIKTARAKREQQAREFKVAIHGARQQIAMEHSLWKLAQSEVEMVEDELLPNAERTLALCIESFEVGEITLLETLALQRALVDARTTRIETRAARAQHSWNLLAASGCLLTTDSVKEYESPKNDEH